MRVRAVGRRRAPSYCQRQFAVSRLGERRWVGVSRSWGALLHRAVVFAHGPLQAVRAIPGAMEVSGMDPGWWALDVQIIRKIGCFWQLLVRLGSGRGRVSEWGANGGV